MLQPENILLRANGYIALADLGFAKELGPFARSSSFAGTPSYMSPEVFQGKVSLPFCFCAKACCLLNTKPHMLCC
jgi:serine/threonine protein kinase